MHMDLQAIIGEAVQVHMRGEGAVDERAFAHEALVVLQDAIQLVKVLRKHAILLRRGAHRGRQYPSLPRQSPEAQVACVGEAAVLATWPENVV